MYPKPSRPIALTKSRVQNAYVTKCFTSSTDGPAHAVKLYSSARTSKNRSHLRSSTLACADCLTGSPNSCARSSSSAIYFCFCAAVGRCEAASVSATLAASSALPAYAQLLLAITNTCRGASDATLQALQASRSSSRRCYTTRYTKLTR
eukprot:scaffold16642_cov59-Phaeocystis_antarctica.AAC.2